MKIHKAKKEDFEAFFNLQKEFHELKKTCKKR